MYKFIMEDLISVTMSKLKLVPIYSLKDSKNFIQIFNYRTMSHYSGPNRQMCQHSDQPSNGLSIFCHRCFPPLQMNSTGCSSEVNNQSQNYNEEFPMLIPSSNNVKVENQVESIDSPYTIVWDQTVSLPKTLISLLNYQYKIYQRRFLNGYSDILPIPVLDFRENIKIPPLEISVFTTVKPKETDEKISNKESHPSIQKSTVDTRTEAEKWFEEVTEDLISELKESKETRPKRRRERRIDRYNLKRDKKFGHNMAGKKLAADLAAAFRNKMILEEQKLLEKSQTAGQYTHQNNESSKQENNIDTTTTTEQEGKKKFQFNSAAPNFIPDSLQTTTIPPESTSNSTVPSNLPVETTPHNYNIVEDDPSIPLPPMPRMPRVNTTYPSKNHHQPHNPYAGAGYYDYDMMYEDGYDGFDGEDNPNYVPVPPTWPPSHRDACSYTPPPPLPQSVSHLHRDTSSCGCCDCEMKHRDKMSNNYCDPNESMYYNDCEYVDYPLQNPYEYNGEFHPVQNPMPGIVHGPSPYPPPQHIGGYGGRNSKKHRLGHDHSYGHYSHGPAYDCGGMYVHDMPPDPFKEQCKCRSCYEPVPVPSSSWHDHHREKMTHHPPPPSRPIPSPFCQQTDTSYHWKNHYREFYPKCDQPYLTKPPGCCGVEDHDPYSEYNSTCSASSSKSCSCGSPNIPKKGGCHHCNVKPKWSHAPLFQSQNPENSSAHVHEKPQFSTTTKQQQSEKFCRHDFETPVPQPSREKREEMEIVAVENKTMKIADLVNSKEFLPRSSMLYEDDSDVRFSLVSIFNINQLKDDKKRPNNREKKFIVSKQQQFENQVVVSDPSPPHTSGPLEKVKTRNDYRVTEENSYEEFLRRITLFGP